MCFVTILSFYRIITMMQKTYIKRYPLTNPYILDEETKPLKAGFYSDVRTDPKIGRNELCTCGSNKKYKSCCINIK